MLYSHRDYKTPFDRGTIFDLTTKQPVNVDRKIRFDEPFNITDGQSDLAQLNAEYHLNSQWTARFDYSYSQDKYSDNQARVTAYDATTGTLTRRVDATQDLPSVCMLLVRICKGMLILPDSIMRFWVGCHMNIT